MTDEEIWKDLTTAYQDFARASNEFNQPGVNRVKLIRKAIQSVSERRVAIRMLSTLKISELQELFPDLIDMASWSHGAVGVIHETILKLPHAWLMDHIEVQTERLLQSGTEDEYGRFLQLYRLLDRQLAHRLALRAVNHTNSEIQEVGKDFLESELL